MPARNPKLAQYPLWLPRELKFQLMAKADENQRSLNKEIVAALQNHVREQYKL